MARFLLLLLHNALLPAGLLLMAPGALRKMRARGGRIADLWQRCGFFSPQLREQLEALRQGKTVFWLHAASVGEVGVAAKLIGELQRQERALGIVLTTTTPTGFREAEKVAAKLGGQVVPLYSALDGWFVVRRFLDVICPKQMVLVEAEIWPNLLHACVARGIPVSLVNARLSPRSEARYGKVRPIAGAIFSMFDRVYVQEPEDVGRWRALGVPLERIEQPGSVKFDMKGQSEPVEQTARFSNLLRRIAWDESDPVLLAASTHAGEEIEIARVFLNLKRAHPSLRLLIVPRHMERGAGLVQDLGDVGLNVVRRSLLEQEATEAGEGPPDCLLVDTTGELCAWQYLATAVIVGKSFLAKGGQNPAEAVMAGRPVLFGPHMENFAALVRHLRSHGGAIQVPDFGKLEEKLGQLLRHPQLAMETARAGREALLPHEGATRLTAERLLQDAGL